jgi:hypothetical protein
MADGIDMRRLHQGCGESLQSNIPGIPLLKRVPVVDLLLGRRGITGRIRYKQNHRRNESDN